MNSFLTFRELDKNGQLAYFILQRAWPHYIGRISEIYEPEAIACSNITNHRLWVVFNGVLQGNYIPAQNGVQEEIKKVFQSMADFYYKDRVVGNEKRFKKWLI